MRPHMFDAYRGASAAGFISASYMDCEQLRAYLTHDRLDDSIADAEIDMLRGLVEEMAEYRFHAEESASYAKHKHLVAGKKRELPLDWAYLLDEMTKAEADPPLRLITSIANNQLSLIDRISKSMRKYLRRERQMQHLSQAQQVDDKCLLWLTRQPGYSAVQKAGARQQILAVVRKESYDTLENRVFKHFLRLALATSRRYLRDYQAAFSETSLIANMRKLASLCNRELHSEQMQGVGDLRSLPSPNYVLMHDKNYRLIWQLYKKLILQEQFIIWVWPYRHQFMLEYFQLFFSASLRIDDYEAVFESKIWLRPTPDKGAFLTHVNFSNAYTKSKSMIEISSSSSSSDFILRLRAAGQEKRVAFYYLPKAIELSDLAPARACDASEYGVVINASGHRVECSANYYVVNTSSNAISEVVQHLKALLEEMLSNKEQ